jgi:ribosomal protein L44E
MLYGANAWYTPKSIKNARKGVVNKLKSLQRKYLRIVAGAYKATLTEALEIEIYTQPIDIALEDRVAKTILRIGASHARHVIEGDTKRIRQQMRSKRGRQARIRKTLGQRKEQ